VTSGDPGNHTFLVVRHQCGPEYTTYLEVEMWGLWLTLDCLDDEAVAAGVLIFSDSQWALNVLKESGHSAHSVLAPLRARLRSLKGCVCFQWVPAYCGLLRKERADGEARKAANLGSADGAQRGRICFDVVKGLIQSQVKDGLPNQACTLQVYGDGPFRHLQGASRREEVLLAKLRGNPEKGPMGGLYMPMLWGGEGGLGARPEGVPRVEEPQEKELYASPSPTLGYIDRSG
jgi:hypothetical protein